MLFDKLSLFADGKTVPTTANANTYSKVLDLRKCGELGIDGGLKVYGQVVGAANATGSITTVVQTSANGAAWTDIASQVQNGNLLIGMFLPFGLKRFVRLKFAVGAMALGSAVVVKAGLVDQFDMDGLPSLQEFPSPGKSGGAVEDLVDAADAIRKAEELGIQLSASAVSLSRKTADTTTGTAVYVTNTLGTVAAAVTLSGSPSDHVTATQDSTDTTKWTLKSTSSITAAEYLVTFTDGFGNKAVVTVTGSTASS